MTKGLIAKGHKSKSSHAKESKQPETVEDLLEEATKEEGQGERWRVDFEKSQRRYDEARNLVEKALLQSPEDTFILNEAGRLNYLMAATFDSALVALNRLSTSIKFYRKAYQFDSSYVSAFNLAQSLTTLGDFLQDGAADNRMASLEYWKEGIALYDTIEGIQRQLISEQGLDFEADEEEASFNSNEPLDASTNTDMEVEVKEVVTPSTIIDTILAKIEALQSLLSYIDSTEERKLVWNKMEESITLARQLDPHNDRSVDISSLEAQSILLRVELEFETSNLESLNINALTIACETLQKICQHFPANQLNLEALTIYADTTSTASELMFRATLLSNDPTTKEQTRTLALQLFQESWKSYEDVLNLLEAPMLPRVPSVRLLTPNEFAPTIGNTLSALSYLALVLSLVRSDTNNSNNGILPNANQTLEGALRLVKRAVSVTTIANRKDWALMKAKRQAVLLYIRVNPSMEPEEAVKLLKESEISFEGIKVWVGEEIRNDLIWLVTGGREESMWEKLAIALA